MIAFSPFWPLVPFRPSAGGMKPAVPCFRAGRLLPPGLVAAALVLLLHGLAPSARGQAGALQSYEKEQWESALQQYQRLAAGDGEAKNPREQARIAYGIGAASYQSGEFEKALPAFSDSLLAEDASVRRNGHEGMGNTLYLLGETTREKEPETTLPRWRDGLLHLQAAQQLEPANERLAKNILFLRKRLLDLEEKVEKQKQEEAQQNQPGAEGQTKSEGQGQGKKPEGEGKGNDPGQPPEGTPEGKPGDGSGQEQSSRPMTNGGPPSDQPKEKGDTILDKESIEKQEAAPQGKLEAQSKQSPPSGNNPGASPSDGQSQEKPLAPADPNQTADKKTGYSPSEARRLLEQLADEDWKARPRTGAVPERAYRNW